MSFDKAGKVLFVDLPKAMQGKNAKTKVVIGGIIVAGALVYAGWWLGRKAKGK